MSCNSTVFDYEAIRQYGNSLTRRASRRQGLPRFIGYDLGSASCDAPLKRVFNIDIEVCGRYSHHLPGHDLRQGELMRSIKRECPGVQGELMRSIKRECPGVQGELMRSIKRECPGVHCLFSLGRIPGKQHSISRDATKKFVGIASGAPDRFVPGL